MTHLDPSLAPRAGLKLLKELNLLGRVSLLGAVACSSTVAQAPPPSAEPAKGALAAYLPLEDDTISQFESLVDGGNPGMFVLEISRPREDLAELRIAGRVQRLYVAPERVSHAQGGTLLEEPLRVGHQFQGSFGRVTITELDHSIRVPAGPFEHCLVTVEESTQPPRRATSVYCKNVGLVTLKVESFSGHGEVVENQLVQHGPRFK